MEIVLYGVPVSVFVAKVRIALEFKGVDYREEAPPGGHGSDAYRAIVPAGSVPGLTLDGAPLHGSNAIVELIEELRPDPPLLPAAPHARALTRALLDFHDSRLEAAARALFPVVKRDWRKEPDAAITGVAAIDSALHRLQDLVLPHPFHLGAAPTIADMAFPATIQMAEMLAAELERPLSPPPVIDEWRKAAAEIPAVAHSLGIAGDAMELWLAQSARRAGPRREPKALDPDAAPPDSTAMLIYKIFTVAEWAALDAGGETRGAPVDLADGFIHFSTAEQAPGTAAKHFAGESGLILAAVEADSLGPALRWEPSRGGALFPHLYAPLARSAVRWIAPLPLGEDGAHVFPAAECG